MAYTRMEPTDEVGRSRTALSRKKPGSGLSADSGFPAGRLLTSPIVFGAAGVVLFLCVWELVVAQRWLNPAFVASPINVAKELWDVIFTGSFWNDMRVSGEEFGIGLGISVVSGVLIGILYGWYRTMRSLFSPWVNGLNAMPQIALVPTLILVFGIGIWSKVVIIILTCVTSLILNTASGMETIDYRFIRLARSLGASDRKLFMTVALPHSLPYILTGLRLATGRALIAVVVGELFASTAGIGHTLVNAANNYQTPLAFADLVVITIVGILFNFIVSSVEKRFSDWRR